jgi:hypothetical protein
MITLAVTEAAQDAPPVQDGQGHAAEMCDRSGSAIYKLLSCPPSESILGTRLRALRRRSKRGRRTRLGIRSGPRPSAASCRNGSHAIGSCIDQVGACFPYSADLATWSSPAARSPPTPPPGPDPMMGFLCSQAFALAMVAPAAGLVPASASLGGRRGAGLHALRSESRFDAAGRVDTSRPLSAVKRTGSSCVAARRAPRRLASRIRPDRPAMDLDRDRATVVLIPHPDLNIRSLSDARLDPCRGRARSGGTSRPVPIPRGAPDFARRDSGAVGSIINSRTGCGLMPPHQLRPMRSRPSSERRLPLSAYCISRKRLRSCIDGGIPHEGQA